MGDHGYHAFESNYKTGGFCFKNNISITSAEGSYMITLHTNIM